MSDIERIATGVDLWLQHELIDSRQGRNAALDSYDQVRAGFLERAGLEAHMDTGKRNGHFMRYNLLLSAIDEDLLRNNDYTAGKLVHHALMFVSGGFRVQSYLQAANQEEYEAARFGRAGQPNGACSLPITAEVAMAWNHVTDLDLDQYIDLNRQYNAQIDRNHNKIYAWFQEHPEHGRDALAADDEPVQALLNSQHLGLTLAVSHIALTAGYREIEIDETPVLEARSVTEASVIRWGEMIARYSSEG